MREPAQHSEPAAARIRARRDPLVRQRLPGGEVGNPLARQQRAQGVGERFRLPGAGGDREHEPAVLAGLRSLLPRQAGESGGQERPERGRGGEVCPLRRGGRAGGRPGVPGAGGTERLPQRGIAPDNAE